MTECKILLSHLKKHELMPCAAKWKDLEVIMLSEVSQKKTHVICCHLNVESKEMLQVN